MASDPLPALATGVGALGVAVLGLALLPWTVSGQPWVIALAPLLALAAWAALLGRGALLAPLARFHPDGAAAADPLSGRIAQTFAAIQTPRLRGIVRRAVVRTVEVRARLDPGAADALDATAQLDVTLDFVLATARRIAALEAEVARVDASATFEAIKTLEARIAQGSDMHDVSALIDDKGRLEGSLEDLAERERGVVRLYGQLLAATAELSAVRATLDRPGTSTMAALATAASRIQALDPG